MGEHDPNPDICLKEIRRLNGKLNALNRLRGFAVAQQGLQQRASMGGHFLVRLDLENRLVRLNRYRGREEAEAAFAREELHFSENPNVDIVLVKADSVKSLKNLYPNYFADASLFWERIERLI